MRTSGLKSYQEQLLQSSGILLASTKLTDIWQIILPPFYEARGKKTGQEITEIAEARQF